MNITKSAINAVFPVELLYIFVLITTSKIQLPSKSNKFNQYRFDVELMSQAVGQQKFDSG